MEHCNVLCAQIRASFNFTWGEGINQRKANYFTLTYGEESSMEKKRAETSSASLQS